MEQGHRISDVAEALNVEFEGDGNLAIHATAEPADARKDDLAIAMSPKFFADVGKGQARAALISKGSDWRAAGLRAVLISDRPKSALSGLSRMMDIRWRVHAGIHETAVIAGKFSSAPRAVGPFCVIGQDTVIGADAWFGNGVMIGAGVIIGSNVTLGDSVKIGAGVTIGDNFIAHAGACIGADGFSFVTPEVSAVENVRETLGEQQDAAPQSWKRIHSLGSVSIGNDVEVGANTCIDKGTIRDTQIGNGCKIDNLSQIGHNVTLGNDVMVCAQVGIAGSSVIGNNVVLGGQTGISDNVFVGDNAITGGATKVLSNVPAGKVMLGYPAMPMKTQLDIYRHLRRLPRMVADLATLKKKLPSNPKDN